MRRRGRRGGRRRGPRRCWPRLLCRRWRSLRRLLGFSVRTDFALLRHDQRRGLRRRGLCLRRGLRMRCGACQLHRAQRGCRKQHKTEFGHGDLCSWNHFCDEAAGINKQALGRNVARFKYQFGFISAFLVSIFIARSGAASEALLPWREACFRLSRAHLSQRRRIWRGRPIGATRWKFIRRSARQFIRPRRLARLTHRRRRLGLRIPGRIFQWRLGRLARRGRRNFGRFDRHYIATLRLSPRSGRVPLTAAAAIFT